MSLVWTKERPTVEGVYWMTREDGSVLPCRVTRFEDRGFGDGALWAEAPGYHGGYLEPHRGGWIGWDHGSDFKTSWMGPIEPPLPPAPVPR